MALCLPIATSITWRALASREPSVRLFKETHGNLRLCTTMSRLRRARSRAVPIRVKVIFVIDNSGSMGGPPWTRRRPAFSMLSRGSARPTVKRDRFDDTMGHALSSSRRCPPAKYIERATRFVSSLEGPVADTEMVAPLRAALVGHGPVVKCLSPPDRLPDDGAIGNEQEMFDLLALKRGRSRVFMVGIGSAPNSFLMSRMAEIGRGTLTHIGETDQVEDSHAANSSPSSKNRLVTDLKATTDALNAEITPDTCQQTSIRANPLSSSQGFPRLKAILSISGNVGRSQMERKPSRLPAPRTARALPSSGREEDRKCRGCDVAQTRSLQMRLIGVYWRLHSRHHLVSRRTSLIAVDKTPKPSSRPATDTPRSAAEPPRRLGLQQGVR